jgi:hypothetical protein
MLKRGVVLVAIAALAAAGGYVSAAASSEDPNGLAADACPEQTEVLRSAGIEFDGYAGDSCPSMERVQEIAASRTEFEAQMAEDEAEVEALRDAGELAPEADVWMRGVGEDAEPLTPDEVAAVEADIAEAASRYAEEAAND